MRAANTKSWRFYAFLIGISIVLTLLGPTACRSGEVNQSKTQTPTVNNDYVFQDYQELTGLPDQDSAPARVFWLARETYHPLSTFDKTGRAVSSLIYRSLFQLADDNVLEGDLVEETQFTGDGKQVQLVLKAGSTFSDDKQVTADDCRASILTWLNNLTAYQSGLDQGSAEAMYWALDLASLANIEEIVVEDDLRLLIRLKEVDPKILYALTMPVVEAGQVSGQTAPAGSAAYEMAAFDQKKSELIARDPGSRLQKIDLLAYPDEGEAMNALLEDKLDIVLLSEDSYYRYRVLDNLRILSCAENIFYFLQPGHGSLISQADFNQAFRQLWLQRDDLFRHISGSERYYNLPLARNDRLWSGFDLYPALTDLPDLTDFVYPEEEMPPVQCLAPQDQVGQSLMENFAEGLRSIGFQVELKLVNPEQYQTELDQFNYDFALNWFATAPSMDLHERLRAYSQACGGPNLDLAPTDMDMLWYLPGREKLGNKLEQSYIDSAKRNADLLPAYGLGFARSGLVLGDRVFGSLGPNQQDPYAGISDLWVWQKYQSQTRQTTGDN